MLSVDNSIDQSLVGNVIRSGEPMLIPSLRVEQIKAITLPESADYIVKSAFKAYCLSQSLAGAACLARVGLFRDRSGRPYTADDQSFPDGYVLTRTGLADRNCRLFESLREEIEERLSSKTSSPGE